MKSQITIIMPIYNGATTLNSVFRALERQQDKSIIDRIIFLDDLSNDGSGELVKQYIKGSSYSCKLIVNTSNKGLARNYNEGIRQATSPFVITMHQDMVLIERDSFVTVFNKLRSSQRKYGAAFPTILHPMQVWLTYGYWQKCMFSRFVGKEIPMLTGKFDCFSKDALKEIGYFDATRHRTAGEDGDIKIKLTKSGYEIYPSGVKVVHLHNLEENFGIKKYFKKDAQIAEAQGVLLRRYGAQNFKSFLMSYFRQLLLLMLLVPYLRYLGLALIALYSIAYTFNVLTKVKDIRNLILPLVNILLLFVATYYSLKGFIKGKQTL